MRILLLWGILCLTPLLLYAQYERLGSVATKITDIHKIGDTYYGNCYNGIYKSEDQGENWELVSEHRNADGPGLTRFFVYDTIMYSAERSGNIMRSTDRGISFTPVSPTLGYSDWSHFVQKNDSIIYFNNGARF